MAIRSSDPAILGSVFSAFDDLLAPLRRPPRRQVAALCWRHGRKGRVEVLLVTTRRTGRWTPPKGNLMRGRTAAASAAREAWEEAGVRGRVRARPLGAFRSEKQRDGGLVERTRVSLFALEVGSLSDKHPEAELRRRTWFPQAEAAAMVRERDLAALIREFDPA